METRRPSLRIKERRETRKPFLLPVLGPYGDHRPATKGKGKEKDRMKRQKEGRQCMLPPAQRSFQNICYRVLARIFTTASTNLSSAIT